MTSFHLPPQVETWLQQGLDLHQSGKVAEAASLYQQALQLQPRNPDILALLGTAEYQLGHLERSAALLSGSIEIDPEQPDVHYNLGNVQVVLGHREEALSSYDKALRLNPAHVAALINRGNALKELGREPEALASYDRVVALQPGFAEAFYNRGEVLQVLRRFDDAIASYDRALMIRPDYVEAHINRGTVFLALGRPDEALASYDRAASIRPGSASLYNNRGNALERLGRIEEAAENFDKALALDPDVDWLAGHALHMRMHLCDWRRFDERRNEVLAKIADGRKVSMPFPVHALIDSPTVHRKVAEIYATAHSVSNVPEIMPVSNSSDKRIRVAYISSDFRDHPVAHLIAGVFEKHDRMKFEVVAVSLAPAAESTWRSRIAGAADHFVDVSELPDSEAISKLRDLQIDIAVDLNGFTDGHRARIFAERVAPVQVSYLGYLGTMGAPFIDYLLADDVIIPENGQSFYAEKIAYLPSYQINDDTQGPSNRVFSREELGLPETGFIFCSFNQTFKLTPERFGSWMRILAQVPGSVLWLYVNNEAVSANLRNEAERHGIAPERLIFAGRLPLEEHLARLSAADLFLDTHPYNAGATASNALRMGLPVLTCIGESFAARMGASLLTAVGLPELIAETPAAYETLAVELAIDPVRLGAIKRKLADNLQTCSLFDTERSVRALEAAYAVMHR
jgi:predicted O-linked N-acetylglucosamine transferase (SPINDLY family)